MSKFTPSGIARPVNGAYSTFATARTLAKSKNQTNGRGYRALKARDGAYGVIFRPAVANNKQRRVRTLPV
jgi:hypothetical protein